jgi:hypothetical protein
MSNPLKTSSRCCNLSGGGLTLIEVLAALALVGTLLVSVIMARAQHVRQLARAQRTLQVTAAVDNLLAGWWPPPPEPPEENSSSKRTQTSIPSYGSGDLPGFDGLQWQTEPLADDSLETFGAWIIRLTVTDTRTHEIIIQLDLAAPESGSGSDDVAEDQEIAP